jgi:phosphoadenosine phosphosulfate reductase
MLEAILDLEAINRGFQGASAEDIIAWAVAAFPGNAAISSSFGAESACLLHLATQIKPDIPVLFVNTGFLFPETLEFKDLLKERLKLNVLEFKPLIPHETWVAEKGKLYETDPDACCAANKVEPMARAIQGIACWMSGVRRDQTAYRAGMSYVERKKDGIVKVSPMASWHTRQVHEYIKKYDLPYHPLWEKGYTSIGCEPCTLVPGDPNDPRSGRWKGQNKKECGIHTFLDEKKPV